MPLERAAIRRLRTGVVPYWELERLSVGYTKVRQIIDQALDAVKSGARPEGLFVKGEWGTGKSHLLSFAREAVSARGFPCARVDLNARSTPLNYPQRFFESIAETVRLRDRLGLRSVLAGILDDNIARARLLLFSRSVAAGDLGWALEGLCRRFEGGERVELRDDVGWNILFGADLGWADYTYKRMQALDRIEILGRMFDAVGVGGLTLVFDEAETIDQLWNVRSRMSAYGVLGRLARSKYLWCAMGITDRFVRTIDDDLDRGVLQYVFATESAAWFLRSWRQSHFTIIEPPTVDLRAARTLAAAVAELYDVAYPNGGRHHERLVEECVRDWATNPVRNPRRLIRVLIHRLDARRSLPVHALVASPEGREEKPSRRVEALAAEVGPSGPQSETLIPSISMNQAAEPITAVKGGESTSTVLPGHGWPSLAETLRAAGLEVIDRRDVGGALWVKGTPLVVQPVLDRLRTRGVIFAFATAGGRATGWRPAWYTKSSL